ncbi:MAG: tripartite tricarboxylate transporter substrate binding protein [Burkholderiales bacterium]
MTKHLVCIALSTGLLLAHNAVYAQTYPAKPIRFIVPFAPGGGNDVVARLIGGKLAEAWGHQVVIDNRPGAGGNIAAELVARSNPDGYTLFLFNSANAIAPSLYKNLAYDPVRDFEPVILISTSPFALVVHPSTPAQSVKELIALARAKPKSLTYASGGNGSSTHLAGEQFREMAGIDIVHVPYKGAGPAFVDLVAGQVTMYFASIPPALPQLKAGRVRALAVSSERRTSLLPDLPTIAEAGLRGYQSGASYGLVVPARTPTAVVKKLNVEVARILTDPDVRARLSSQGMEIASGTPQAFGSFMKAEMVMWARVIKASGARVE